MGALRTPFQGLTSCTAATIRTHHSASLKANSNSSKVSRTGPEDRICLFLEPHSEKKPQGVAFSDLPQCQHPEMGSWPLHLSLSIRKCYSLSNTMRNDGGPDRSGWNAGFPRKQIGHSWSPPDALCYFMNGTKCRSVEG